MVVVEQICREIETSSALAVEPTTIPACAMPPSWGPSPRPAPSVNAPPPVERACRRRRPLASAILAGVGSVVVSWNGSCPQRPVRDALISQLEPIAQLSHSYFDGGPAISFYNEHVEGQVVVPEAIAAGYPAAVSILDEDDSGSSPGIELRSAGPLHRGITIRGPLYQVPAIDLHGIAFRLYDGRGLYPDEDILSFVFATIPGSAVAPHSAMVEVLSADHRDRVNRAAAREATCCLLRPSVHLRYYCEQWINLLLGTVKYFFVPDLHWWAHEDCPGYPALEALFESRAGDPASVDTAFDALVEGLRSEVDTWRDEAATVKAFWDSMRKE